MFMFCSIMLKLCTCIMYAALNDSHYFFIFHRMLTATEQNMYFDFLIMLHAALPKSNCN